MVWPVIEGEFAKKTTDSETSCEDGPNPNGDWDWIASSESASRTSLVRTCPGATELTLILGARSIASAEVNPCIANLEPVYDK